MNNNSQNKLEELVSFGKEIISLCKENGVTPIIYGSYLFRHYTKDKMIIPHDIDFYVPEGCHEKIIAILKKRKMKYKYLEQWHCLMIYKGGLKVDLDSIDFLYKGPKDFKNFYFGGVKIKCLSLDGLISVYKMSIGLSDEPEKNKARYEALQARQLNKNSS